MLLSQIIAPLLANNQSQPLFHYLSFSQILNSRKVGGCESTDVNGRSWHSKHNACHQGNKQTWEQPPVLPQAGPSEQWPLTALKLQVIKAMAIRQTEVFDQIAPLLEREKGFTAN